jgi:cell division protein FtsN
MNPMKHTPNQQRGGFGLGLIVGLLLGLAVALGVALYVTKVPIPFVDKVPQRSAEQDEAEARANKNWNPNAPLSSGNNKPVRPAASGVVGSENSAANAPTTVVPPTGTPINPPNMPAVVATPAATPPAKPASAALTAAATASKPAIDPSNPQNKDRFVFFVQAGAFVQPAEAEQQRARLAMQGFTARVYERESQGRVVYRVRIGPFDGESEAEKLKADVEGAGLEAALVRVQR